MLFRRVLRAPVLATLFLISLFGASAVVRRFLPFPQIEGIEAKLAWLAAHGAEYDTLFVGSSRVLWHIVPHEFDAAMAAAGQTTRSFNLGYTSLRPPEDSYVLDQALTTRQAPLRYVVIEADEIALKVRQEIAGTARENYWHDLTRMNALVADAWSAVGTEAGWWASFDERRDAWRDLVDHFPPFLAWASNIGRGEALLRHSAEKRDWTKWVGLQRDGFTEEKKEELSKREAKHLRSQMKNERPGPEVASEASQDLYARMERRIAKTGARMIVFVPPRTETGAFLPDPSRFPQVPVFDFSDAERYPELFDARNRHDSDHLNLAGATIFSRLLATRLLELSH